MMTPYLDLVMCMTSLSQNTICCSATFRNFTATIAVHSVIFDVLDGSVILTAALQTSDAAGLSDIDAYGWRRLCSSCSVSVALPLPY